MNGNNIDDLIHRKKESIGKYLDMSWKATQDLEEARQWLETLRHDLILLNIEKKLKEHLKV